MMKLCCKGDDADVGEGDRHPPGIGIDDIYDERRRDRLQIEKVVGLKRAWQKRGYGQW